MLGLYTKRENRDIIFLIKLKWKIRSTVCRYNNLRFLLSRGHKRNRFAALYSLNISNAHKALWKLSVKLLLKVSSRNRLYEITIKSCLRIKTTILLACICGKHDDARLTTESAELISYGIEAFDTIHIRHQVIHKDKVILLIKSHLQCLRTALRSIYLYLGLAKQLLNYKQVCLIIINNQKLSIRCLDHLLIICTMLQVMSLLEIILSELFFRNGLLRNSYDKCTTLRIYTVYLNCSTHQVKKLFND